MATSSSNVQGPGRDALEDIAAAQQYVLDLQVLFYSLKTVAASAHKTAEARVVGESGAAGAASGSRRDGEADGRAADAAATAATLQRQVEELSQQLEEEQRAKARVQEQYERATAMLRKSYGQIVDDYLFATEQLHERTRQLERLMGTAPPAHPASPASTSDADAPQGPSLRGTSGGDDDDMQAVEELRQPWYSTGSNSVPPAGGAGTINTTREDELEGDGRFWKASRDADDVTAAVSGGSTALGGSRAQRQRMAPSSVRAGAAGDEAAATAEVSCFASSRDVAALAAGDAAAAGPAVPRGGSGGSGRNFSGGSGAAVTQRDGGSTAEALQNAWLLPTDRARLGEGSVPDGSGSARWSGSRQTSTEQPCGNGRSGAGGAGGSAVAVKRAASPTSARTTKAASAASKAAVQQTAHQPVAAASEALDRFHSRDQAPPRHSDDPSGAAAASARSVEGKGSSRRQRGESQRTGNGAATQQQQEQQQPQQHQTPRSLQHQQHRKQSSATHMTSTEAYVPGTCGVEDTDARHDRRGQPRAAESPPVAAALKSPRPLAAAADSGRGKASKSGPVELLSPASAVSAPAAAAAARQPSTATATALSPLLRRDNPDGPLPAAQSNMGARAAKAKDRAGHEGAHTFAAAAGATAGQVSHGPPGGGQQGQQPERSRASRDHGLPGEPEPVRERRSGGSDVEVTALPGSHEPSGGARDAAAVLEAAGRAAQAAARAAAAKAARAVAELSVPLAKQQWTFQSRQDSSRVLAGSDAETEGASQQRTTAAAATAQAAGVPHRGAAGPGKSAEQSPGQKPPGVEAPVGSCLSSARTTDGKEATAAAVPGGSGRRGAAAQDGASPGGRRAGSAKRLRRSVSSPSERPSPRRSTKEPGASGVSSGSGAAAEAPGRRMSTHGPTRPVPPAEPPSGLAALRHVAAAEQLTPGGLTARGRSLRYVQSAPSPERGGTAAAAAATQAAVGAPRERESTAGAPVAATTSGGRHAAAAVSAAAVIHTASSPRSGAAAGHVAGAAGKQSPRVEVAVPASGSARSSGPGGLASGGGVSCGHGAALPGAPAAGPVRDLAPSARGGAAGPDASEPQQQQEQQHSRATAFPAHRPIPTLHAVCSRTSEESAAVQHFEARGSTMPMGARPVVVQEPCDAPGFGGSGLASAAAASAAAAAANGEAAAAGTPGPGQTGASMGTSTGASPSSSSSLEGLASLVRDLRQKLEGLQRETNLGILEDDDDVGGDGDDDDDDDDVLTGNYGDYGAGTDVTEDEECEDSDGEYIDNEGDSVDGEEAEGKWRAREGTAAASVTAATAVLAGQYGMYRDPFGGEDREDDVDGDVDTYSRPGLAGGLGGYGYGGRGFNDLSGFQGAAKLNSGRGDGGAGVFAPFPDPYDSVRSSGAATPRGPAQDVRPELDDDGEHRKESRRATAQSAAAIDRVGRTSPRSGTRRAGADSRTTPYSLLDEVTASGPSGGPKGAFRSSGMVRGGRAGYDADGLGGGRTGAGAAFVASAGPLQDSLESVLEGTTWAADGLRGGWPGGGGGVLHDRSAPSDQTSPRKPGVAAFSRAASKPEARRKVPSDRAGSDGAGSLSGSSLGDSWMKHFGGSATAASAGDDTSRSGSGSGAAREADRASTGATGAAANAAAAAASHLQGLRSDAMFARIKQQLDDLQSSFAQGLGLGPGSAQGLGSAGRNSGSSSAGAGATTMHARDVSDGTAGGLLGRGSGGQCVAAEVDPARVTPTGSGGGAGALSGSDGARGAWGHDHDAAVDEPRSDAPERINVEFGTGRRLPDHISQPAAKRSEGSAGARAASAAEAGGRDGSGGGARSGGAGTEVPDLRGTEGLDAWRSAAAGGVPLAGH